MAKEIRDNSIVDYNFYQSAEDVPDLRELSSEKKNLIVCDDLLLEKQRHANRIVAEEDTATLILSISLQPISNFYTKQSERTRISFICFPKT